MPRAPAFPTPMQCLLPLSSLSSLSSLWAVWPTRHAARAVVALAALGAFLCAGNAGAAATDTAAPGAADHFGVVWRVRGEAGVDPGGGAPLRPLHEGDVVSVGEHIRTGATGEVVIKADDAGLVAVRPAAEFVAESFAASGRDDDHVTLRLISGSLRIVTGWIGRINRSQDRLITPSATVGIRGTDHEPYLLAAEAASGADKPGLYDKVNRGATSLAQAGAEIEIPAGRVGFARAPGENTVRTRSLLTILLPTLLERVPEFFVPGSFDADIEAYSEGAEAESLRQLQLKRSAAATAPATPPVACVPERIARDWLKRFDGAVARHDAPAIVALFAPEIVVHASVRQQDGSITRLDVGRDELSRSTVQAMQDVTHFRERRIGLEASDASEPAGTCSRIRLKSVQSEQGLLKGKPYHFDATESYTLENRAGSWVAVEAETLQR